MDERKMSELQREYRTFFLGKMRLFNVSSPAELTKEKKSEFFTEIKRDWAEYKRWKQQRLQTVSPDCLPTTQEPTETYEVSGLAGIPPKSREEIKRKLPQEHSIPVKKTGELRQKNDLPSWPVAKQSFDRSPKQVIKSQPNAEQTDDLRILFAPNDHFSQEEQYKYPVVKMPKPGCSLKLPRYGRSNQKGYKENDFYNQIQERITNIGIDANLHMVIPNFNKPYEPDIVLFDKSLNLYIDIEIDEPYDGYYRYPTHYVDPEEQFKQDNVRDLFFIESGWIVIRFTEKQVHCQPDECLEYIQNVLNSIHYKPFKKEALCEIENQWDYNQCIQWQKSYYRETYLGITRFQKQHSYKEIQIDTEEAESIENIIQRTKQYDFDSWNSSIAFDEQSHKYLHPKDQTGNAEYIAVTTVIERFFPFDLKRYIERKAAEENRTEEDVFDEYYLTRDEAADKGTYLHSQIENFLKGNTFDSQTKEFQLFLQFYEKEAKGRKLVFFDAEKRILSNKHNVAGTIDCLFRKPNSDEFVMLDWKRSKKLIIDGFPRIFGYGCALSELHTMDNSSYNRYCLQQNIYRQLLETEYSMKISSMKLVVLHENYSKYHIIDVPVMKKETDIIFESLKLKV